MAELGNRQRFVVLAICCMSLLIVSIDNTALNVALPSIRRELGASVSGMQWTIDAYTLTLASLLMLSGSTADRIGRRKVFTAGLVIFVLASLLCSVAPNLESLVAFRALQGVGGSMLNPVAMSIITNTFTDPAQRARAIGVWGGVIGISMAAGPLVGGLLVDTLGWRSIFWINLPIGLVALILTWRFIPESKAPRPRRPDPVGQLLVMALLASVTYGIIEAHAAGFGSVLILGCATTALLALIALIRYERRHPEPLIDPRFFTSAPFSGAVVIAICAFSALGGFLFLNTIYLQEVRGLSAMNAGLYMLPMAGLTLVLAPLSGRVVGSRGPRGPLLVAGAGIASSGLLFALLTAETSTPLLFTGYVLFGIGFGVVNAPITNTAVTGMPRAQAGVAAAVASTSRQTGQTLGVALIGAILAAGVHSGGVAQEFTTAAQPAYWVITGCGLLVLVMGAVTTGAWGQRTAARTSAKFETPKPPTLITSDRY
ncbi:MFS transporter [Streptomyces sp. NPDC006879]|uniref:MFS transporter n=1 Tax=Streptomyces sp. NPDC006879 TaxID=3364767 RepID=UPI00367B4562